MRRHLRRHRLDSEVELNMAAMLDMAFQLLAFFILTFRPSPFEGQLLLRLPPPVPITKPMTGLPDADQAIQMAAAEKSLDVWLLAGADGRISTARIGLANVFEGPADPANLAKLDQFLRNVFAVQNAEVDQVLLHVAPELHYEDLMKVIDVCIHQKLADGTNLRTINFTEHNPAADGK